jgi:hypothetical protein
MTAASASALAAPAHGRRSVADRAGLYVGDPHGKAGLIGEHLQAAAESVVLAGVPQVVTAFGPGGDPVGR